MTGEYAEAEIKRHVRAYMFVFAALWTLTVCTVTVSYLHLAKLPAVMLALCIASVKGSLVACYFMHLISEKRLIYLLLVITAIFFLGLLFLPLFSQLNQLKR